MGQPELDALLAADNEAPRVVLVARPGLATVEELPGTRTRYSPYGVTLEAGDPGAVAAVIEGRAGVQDEGSQLVALALTRAAVGRGAMACGWTCVPGQVGRPRCSPRSRSRPVPGCWPSSGSTTERAWCAGR